MIRPNRYFWGLFVDRIAVCVLNPGVVTNSSQVSGQTQCVLWIIRPYFCRAARTFRLHNYTHGSHLTLRITNDPSSLCRTQVEGAAQ